MATFLNPQTITFTTGNDGGKGDFIESAEHYLKYKWDMNNDKDVLYVYAQKGGESFTSGEYIGQLDLDEVLEDGYKGVFKGTFVNVPEKGWLRFIHYGHSVDVSKISTDGVSVKYYNQYGTLEKISDNVIAKTDVEINSSNEYDCELDVLFSVIRFNLAKLGTAEGTEAYMYGNSKNTISVSNEGVVSMSGYNKFKLNNVNTSSDKYDVVVMPDEDTDLLVFWADDQTCNRKTTTPVICEDRFYSDNGSGYELSELSQAMFTELGIENVPAFYKYNLGVNPDDLTTPEKWYGGYYAWGELTEKGIYSWSNYEWCGGTDNTLTKYNSDPAFGSVDNKTRLDRGDDAASEALGSTGKWRIPSEEDFKNLSDSTYFVWTQDYKMSGLNGYVVYRVKDDSDKGKVTNDGAQSQQPTASYDYNSDLHVFWPAAGAKEDDLYRYLGSVVRYWSDEVSKYPSIYPIDKASQRTALNFYMDHLLRGYDSNLLKCSGFSIRPAM